MTRIKKSRKPGSLGLRKTDKRPNSNKSTPVQSKVNRKGLKPGARNSEVLTPDNATPHNHSAQNDPRVGSKTPVLLNPDSKSIKTPVEKIQQPQIKLNKAKPANKPIEAWQQELFNLEQDESLQDLLNRYDDNETLTAAEQAELNKKMARHAWLMEKLGLNDIDDDEALLDAWENMQIEDKDS